MNTGTWLRGAAILALAAAFGGGTSALAQSGTPASGTSGPAAYGPGMMRGYGPGMRGRHNGGCPGLQDAYRGGRGGMYGYWMGRHGMGYGMGPVMMGGYGMGMGPGMMGGRGMGYMMLYGPEARALGLSSEQRGKIAGIWDGAMQKAWPIMGQLREANFKFARLMHSPSPNPGDVRKVHELISSLQLKLIEIRLEARGQMMKGLTPAQMKTLREAF